MKLTENIHLLRVDFEIQISSTKQIPRFVNVLILMTETITLIDTGVKGSEQQIFQYLEQYNRHYSEISTIILSHSHPDHIGSAAIIKELTNCTVYAHKYEIDWIENIEIQRKHRPVPSFYNLLDRSVFVDEVISDKQIFQLTDGLTLECFLASGHSKGSINMLFKEDNILFTADSIPLKSDIPNYDNYNDLMKTIQKIKSFQELSVLLTSWTTPVLDKSEMFKLINEAELYMKQINKAVKANYKNKNINSLLYCKQTVEQLGLPPFMINKIVDRAFKSHLK